MKRVTTLLISAAVATFLAFPVAAKDKMPETTNDGLHLVKDTKVAAVYLLPDTTFDEYDKILLVECAVAFAKNWQRNYNRTTIAPGDRITDSDMEKIKSEVSAEFNKIFSEELKKGGYEVVTERGEGVMIMRPAIVNLDINAPDTDSPGMRAVVVSSAGTLTLYAELWDSVSNAKIAEIMDAQEAGDRSFGYRANRTTNKAALDRTLRHWAGLMVNGLDEAHGKND